MKQFGLIGYPLTHSFSKKYFADKFEREGITDCRYDLFELPDITRLPDVLQTPNLRGLNVTIPHKQAVFPYLDRLDSSAQKVGAVNVIRLEDDGTRTGFNSDYYGFRQSLEEWFRNLDVNTEGLQALVLGTGGAAKAVTVVLTDLGIPYRLVSRTPSADRLTYEELPRVIADYRLIINTSPVGTYPHTDECPNLPYDQLTAQHLLYDLIYNPAETLFMRQGRERGAATHNGHRMLVLQAEKSWEIWNG
ncbi:shikimate dehydrogenase [Nibrella viscosa]|uniref:Shikimate dehydrogenase n=1 Tax=Nibrella viscosa TaxID=1084524 RepID=A0ABP8KK32_9BACT